MDSPVSAASSMRRFFTLNRRRSADTLSSVLYRTEMNGFELNNTVPFTMKRSVANDDQVREFIADSALLFPLVRHMVAL
jgi:hypothetical protein